MAHSRTSRLVIALAFFVLQAGVLAACSNPPDVSSLSYHLPSPISGPLHTDGSKLVDSSGKVVHLSGINWFGFETTTFAPHGLQVRNWRDMLSQMVQAGFNTI